jgi:hypothetical protein
MPRRTSPDGILAGSLAAIAVIWFLASLGFVMLGVDELRFDVRVRVLHGVGISLPWAALVLSVFLHEDFPGVARRIVLGALGAAFLLATAAVLHNLWIDPALGRAVRALDLYAILRVVDRMWAHEILLTVHGPLVSVVAWWLLRWMESSTARPPRRPGSLVRTG